MDAEGRAALDEELRGLLRLPAWQVLDEDGDGRLLLRSDEGGSMQLHELAGGRRRALTALPDPVGDARYVPGRRTIVVQHDAGGNERHQLSLLDARSGELAPLVHDAEHIHALAGVSPDGLRVAYTTNRRNGVDLDLWLQPLDGGAGRCLYDGGGMCAGHGFSPDGRWLTLERPGERPMDVELLLVEAAGGRVQPLERGRDAAVFGRPAWLADSSAFLFPANDGRDTIAIARYDLATASWRYVLEGDRDLECFAGPGAAVLVVANADGRSRAALHDAATLERLAELPLPEHGVASWRASLPPPLVARDGSQVTYSVSTATAPARVRRWRRASGETAELAGAPAPRGLAEPQLHRLLSFDGLELPLELYRPPDAAGAAPVVVHVHGGPESQARPVFQPVIQGLVRRGIAVAVPNVRGSTGYGKRYYGLDDGRRRLDSVRDLDAIHGWLAGAGLDPARAALWGGSYGGYMALAGVSMQPALWAAAVVLVGISDLVSFLERTSPYRRSHREHEYGSLAHDRDFLERASPLRHADAIRAPLFLVHGANDPRVPLSEATQLAERLRSRGGRCELLVYGDEGHGLARLANRLDAYPRAIDFLAGVLRTAA